ncbi:MAG TPA: cytochrome b5-like heme/steroid binding domain-containing protein [Candidatus Paceibacterota bacterium]|nr:cytochrome b5-like heme/steroid binding domain-containing protein [Candidatus Paceibacterota bacterium]
MNLKILAGIILAFVAVAGGILFFISPSAPEQAPTTGERQDPSQQVSTSTGEASSSSSISMEMVAGHNSAASCWSTINGKVYDLTSWINRHPGGPDAILSLCGKDGSSAFNAQHGGQSRPANELAGFYIGDAATH